ncbi:hypothetical protein [Roseibium sediminicola]|uniref:Alpha/beta hydrolase n=1 Tax=Roseibium sediminicola TaxID=2933272 RepID=A0ABT0GSS6_9HYPH|nr:hypothetical protein [Roseibium sp. CAU 1639]MCK7612494.1 hypothetical protein [Roseibium sp. CAU 1639]
MKGPALPAPLLLEIEPFASKPRPNPNCPQTLEQFDDLYRAFPGITTLVLTDISGSSDDATNVRLGYRVRKLGLATHVPAGAEIYSGGVDLFLAGVQRTIGDGAVLGVHSWDDGTRDGADYPKDSPAHDEARSYTEAMLGDDRFYWFTLSAAPSDGIHVMKEREIRDYHLVTE